MMLWILITVGTLALSAIASARVKSKYSRWIRVPTSAGMTGAQVAAWILQKSGISDVEIVAARGELTDHYDPIHKRLVLSERNYHGASVAAAGIAAHECGHAIQHKIAYAPLNWRMASVGLMRFTQPMMWIPILGMGLGLIAPYTGFMLIAIAMGVVMVFQLITLPVEFDATRRAKLILTEGGLIRGAEEEKGMNSVLDAAALTYVAAFISSLAWFLYYLLPLLTGRSSN